MNDFTKEELKQLLSSYCADYYYGNTELAHKIQSMIDNYCEHTDKLLVNNCVNCRVKEFRCNTCGTINYEGIE